MQAQYDPGLEVPGLGLEFRLRVWGLFIVFCMVPQDKVFGP